jgi:hypothetical protein
MSIASFFCCAMNVVLNLECEFLCVEGTSSLLSLVKTFDSVLAVYEGFCNLKQVRFVSFLLIHYFYFFSSLFLTLFLDARKRGKIIYKPLCFRHFLFVCLFAEKMMENNNGKCFNGVN